MMASMYRRSKLDSHKNEIIRSLQRGRSLGDISDDVMCHRVTLRVWILRNKSSWDSRVIDAIAEASFLDKARRKLDKNSDVIIHELRHGASTQKIATLAGTNLYSAQSWIDQNSSHWKPSILEEIQTQRERRRCPAMTEFNDHKKAVITWILAGKPKAWIAQKVGRSVQALNLWMRKLIDSKSLSPATISKINQYLTRPCYIMENHRKDILQWLSEGVYQTEIAQRLNVCPTSVSRWIRKNSVHQYQKNKITTKANQKTIENSKSSIRRWLQNGQTQSEISLKLDVPYHTLNLWVRHDRTKKKKKTKGGKK